MLRLKNSLLTICASFTATIIIFAILGEFHITPMVTNHIIYQLFVLNVLIELLMLITDRFPYKTVYSWMAVSIVDIFLVVFLVGGVLMKMFPFYPYLIAIISLMLFSVFFIVYGIMALKNHSDANSINKILGKRRKSDGSKNH